MTDTRYRVEVMDRGTALYPLRDEQGGVDGWTEFMGLAPTLTAAERDHAIKLAVEAGLEYDVTEIRIPPFGASHDET